LITIYLRSFNFAVTVRLQATAGLGEARKIDVLSALPMHLLKNGFFAGTTKPACSLSAQLQSAGS